MGDFTPIDPVADHMASAHTTTRTGLEKRIYYSPQSHVSKIILKLRCAYYRNEIQYLLTGHEISYCCLIFSM